MNAQIGKMIASIFLILLGIGTFFMEATRGIAPVILGFGIGFFLSVDYEKIGA